MMGKDILYVCVPSDRAAALQSEPQGMSDGLITSEK